jgi:site-specific DNA recombinase
LEKLGIGYIRVSEVGGRGDYLISPELQRHAIETFAARRGIRLVGEIQDIDKSGRSFTKRRVDEAIDGIRAGEYRYVILWKWSRWGRNLKESLIHLSQIEEVGGIVRAATEDFDPDTTMGRFARDQMLLLAQLQSDMIADGWKELQAKRRRDGLPHTGGKRWGYDYDRRAGYTPNPEQARLLASAYEQ